MSSVAGKKIPEMFLRGLKRKQTTVVSSSSSAGSTVEKKGKGEVGEENTAPIDQKPNQVDVQKEVKTKKPSASMEQSKVDESAREAECTPIVDNDNGDDDDQALLSLVRDAEWTEALREELGKPYIGKIEQFLRDERKKGKTVYPPRSEIFSALQLTPLSAVKVVLIGQDPYHNVGQAHGLCFSVKRGIPPPPSLKNIYKELATDIDGFKAPTHGFLENWARQGILMLNAALTVRAHEANSHAKIGWYTLTDRMISIVNKQKEGVVFLLWGGFAHKKEVLVNKEKHVVVKTAHPSPLSARKFMGCRCFSQVNEHLIKLGKEPIRWGDL